MELIYIDSSILVSIALGEPRGVESLTLIGESDSCTSSISPVECQAGLSHQYALTAAGGLPQAEQALNAVLKQMQIIQMTPAVLAQARTLVRRYRSGLGLRTLDALHVAAATEVQRELGTNSIKYITADRRQHTAFTAEGFTGSLLL